MSGSGSTILIIREKEEEFNLKELEKLGGRIFITKIIKKDANY